jgi:hypothetical protein
MKGLFDVIVKNYYGYIYALNIVIMLARTTSAMLLQLLIPKVRNLAVKVLIKAVKKASLLYLS